MQSAHSFRERRSAEKSGYRSIAHGSPARLDDAQLLAPANQRLSLGLQPLVTTADIHQLQRSVGNSVVQHMLSPVPQVASSSGERIQRTFDVHFDVREPGGGVVNQNWTVADAMADGERPRIGQNTMTTVDNRQPNQAHQPGYHLRHVIPWEHIKRDIAAFGGNNPLTGTPYTLVQIANHVHGNWPAQSDLGDPGVPNTSDPRAVEGYAQQWGLARNDDSRNLFWGGAVQNQGAGAAYDQPTKAKGSGHGAQGSAFDNTARRNVVTEQLQGILGGQNYNPAGVVQPAALDVWLSNNSTLTQREIDAATGRANFNTLVNYLIQQGIFNKLRLVGVYNRQDTPYGY